MSEKIRVINGMADVFMFCESPECPCEDVCCQECDKTETCQDKCDNFKFKEKLYHDDRYLIETLIEEAEKTDSWLLAFVAERIEKEINKTEKHTPDHDLLEACKEALHLLKSVSINSVVMRGWSNDVKEMLNEAIVKTEG